MASPKTEEPKKKEERTRDLAAMFSILKDFGITDYEPGVLNQMLEFTYRYVTTIIEDAMLYSTHANKKAIEISDVELAISLQNDKNFAHPPSRAFTAELARQRNATPLPAIRLSAGLRLPPDRYSLTSCNFNLKCAKKPRTVHSVSRFTNARPGKITTSKPPVSSIITNEIKINEMPQKRVLEDDQQDN